MIVTRREALKSIPAALISSRILASRLAAAGDLSAPVVDVVVYGATSAGVSAAIQAARSGLSVMLLEPGHHVGGLTTGGLGQTDIGNKQAIGGLARTFYERVARHYASDSAWRWQKRADYRDGGQTRTEAGEAAMWTFEPSVASAIFAEMLAEAGVQPRLGERLDLNKGVEKAGATITAIVTESGRRYRGRVFIDATYEGDLMARAGVSYHVGREDNRIFGETVNGNQPENLAAKADNHNFPGFVDPFVRAGEPESGLLPGIDPSGPGVRGAGDHRVQAYCYRLCLTDHPDNRVPIEKPEGYDPLNYELLLRNFEAGADRVPWINSSMPNRKTDTNNGRGVSNDFIGGNYAYPEAGYALRRRIEEAHRDWQLGLLWTLAHSPRVPEAIRSRVAPWGLPADEFPGNGHWPTQLYVREARRMISGVVMTEHHCRGQEVVSDSVGLGAYGMDSHHVRRYVTPDGRVRNEGNIQVGVAHPYPISFRSIVPRREECDNLLAPVCLSATHIAFGSIRMEPVFMVLGQSAALAAATAFSEGVDLHDLRYATLRSRLESAGQRLEHHG